MKFGAGIRVRVTAAALAVIFILVATLSVASPAEARAVQAPAPASQFISLGDRYSVEIRPQLELVAGVLLVSGRHEDWERPPKDGGTDYERDLKAFFEPYRDHAAVRLANELYDSGIHTDRFATFAMHLGPLPALDLQYAYSDNFFDSSDHDKLEEFRIALAQLAAESHFADFIAKWDGSFQKWLTDAAGRFDGDRVVEWLERFFGETRAEYRLILAPGIPYGCGLGPWLSGPGGTVTFDIVQDRGDSSSEPDFGSKFDLESLAAHEWGHSYVNPAIAAHSGDMQAFEPFYKSVESSLEKIGYDSLHAYTDEQVLRAAVCVAVEDLYGPERAQTEIDSETDQGFRLTQKLTEMFKVYRGDPGRYPEFRSYVTTMFSDIAKQPEPDANNQFFVALMVVGLLVYALIRLANSGRRPHPAQPQAQPVAAMPTVPMQAEPRQSVICLPGAAPTVPADVTVRPPEPADEETFVHLSRGLTLFNYPHRPPTYDLETAMTRRIERATATFREADEKKLILLAERDGVAVGYVLAWLLPDEERVTGVIDELFVDSDARGAGVGRALLAAADAWFAERCVKRVRLNVFAWNEAAMRFYERAGYTARTVTYQRDVV